MSNRWDIPQQIKEIFDTLQKEVGAYDTVEQIKYSGYTNFFIYLKSKENIKLSWAGGGLPVVIVAYHLPINRKRNFLIARFNNDGSMKLKQKYFEQCLDKKTANKILYAVKHLLLPPSVRFMLSLEKELPNDSA